MVDCPECLSSDLGIVFGHDCPNDSRYAKSGAIARGVSVPTDNYGSGHGSYRRSHSQPATERQIAYMISLGLPEHIAKASTKAHASDHIARLVEEKQRAAKASGERTDGASERQIAFIRSLLSDRPGAFTGDVDSLSKREASDLIGKLKAMPVSRPPSVSQAGSVTASDSVTDGFYVDSDDTVFEVRTSQSGYPYALILDKDTGRFDYSKGAIRDLKSKLANGTAERLTLDRAKSLGVRYARCMICGRTLTNEVSVSEGIGPICAGRL